MLGLMRIAKGKEADEDEDYKQHDLVEGSRWVFLSVGLGTILAGLIGSSPTIVHLESAAGISQGGKTGLTAVVCSFYFLIAIFFAPLFSSLPRIASSPVLLIVGASMIGCIKFINQNLNNCILAFLTLTLTPFTHSISNGLIFGLISHYFIYLVCCKWRRRRIGREGYRNNLYDEDVEF